MRRHLVPAVVSVIGILVLAGCSEARPESADTTTTALEVDPQPVGETLPEADARGLWLPLTFQDLPILDPGWDTEPQFADGVFVGAEVHGDHVEYTAVSLHGEVLWRAQRPPGSTDFRLDDGAGGPTLAVLPDTGGDGAVTLSAYDVRTGELAWGPVAPPGPGARQGTNDAARSSTRGETFHDETTGALVTLDGTTLSAEDARGAQLWTLSLQEGTAVAGMAGGLLYLREGPSIRVHNVMTGDIAQAYDPEGQGQVVVPRMMVTQGATLLLVGDRPLLAPAPEVPDIAAVDPPPESP